MLFFLQNFFFFKLLCHFLNFCGLRILYNFWHSFLLNHNLRHRLKWSFFSIKSIGIDHFILRMMQFSTFNISLDFALFGRLVLNFRNLLGFLIVISIYRLTTLLFLLLSSEYLINLLQLIQVIGWLILVERRFNFMLLNILTIHQLSFFLFRFWLHAHFAWDLDRLLVFKLRLATFGKLNGLVCWNPFRLNFSLFWRR